VDERELLDVSLRRSNLPPLAEVMEAGWLDAAQDFATAHFQQGFPTPDGRFHFAPDWAALGPYADGLPRLPDHVALTDVATEDHPFRLVAPGSRAFLNTSFTEAPTSRRMAGRPTVLVHPQDAAGLAIADEDPVRIGNRRGSLHLHARRSETVPRGTLVVEGVWPNRDFEEGIGINLLVGADPVPPAGGVAFHDTAVWLRRA
jgi:anaerobic selenocysteine-containing dehydrogenase